VVNHAYDKGGERVDILKTVEENDTVKLVYERSLEFPDELLGDLNDLVVIGDGDEFYISQWLPFPHDKYSMKDHSPLGLLKTLYYWIWYYNTYIYYVKFDNTGITTLKQVAYRTAMWNGIHTDGKHIFANDLFGR
jgi:hypothetical protein